MLLYFLITGYFTKVFYNCSTELQADLKNQSFEIRSVWQANLKPSL